MFDKIAFFCAWDVLLIIAITINKPIILCDTFILCFFFEKYIGILVCKSILFLRLDEMPFVISESIEGYAVVSTCKSSDISVVPFQLADGF
jgi:hypothetical protein